MTEKVGEVLGRRIETDIKVRASDSNKNNEMKRQRYRGFELWGIKGIMMEKKSKVMTKWVYNNKNRTEHMKSAKHSKVRECTEKG